MPYVLAIFVDVQNEFLEIAAEIRHLDAALAKLRTVRPVSGSQQAWEAGHICASATEKIYTGLERIMARIATEIDQAPVGHAAGWHRTLLQRIANPFPERRDAVISRECYERLDRLRAFRHRERNTYGLDLDLGIVLDRSAEAIAAFAAFRGEVGSFLASLEHD